MKKIKYIFAMTLFIITFSFIGESYIFYLDNFTGSFYSTSLYKPDYVSNQKMKLDVKESKEKNDIGIFIVDQEVKSNIEMNISIYGTSEANKYLKDKLSIKDTTYKSMFSGKVTVTYHNFDEITDIGKYEKYFLVGDQKNIASFKNSLIDTYGGNHPKIEDDYNESKKNIIYVWSIIIIVILLFTYYDTIFQKKEALVKVTFGEKISTLIRKNVWCDTLVFVSLFIISILFTSIFSNSIFQYWISICVFIVFIIINALIYLTLYKYNLREVFSNSKSKNQLLKINYVLKIITIVLAITVLSGSIAIIDQGLSFYQQKDFFKYHKEYNYIQFDYKLTGDNATDDLLINKSADVREEFYKENFNNAIQLVNISDNLDLSVPSILANKNAIPYLKDNIPELNRQLLNEEKVYYILPEKHADDKLLYESLRNIYGFFNKLESNSNVESEVILYNTNTELVSIDEINYMNRSKLAQNPAIILNNTSTENSILDTETNLRRTSYAHDIMYLISEKSYQSFVTKNDLTDQIHLKTNIYELYQYNWTLIKRGIFISSVLFSLVILLELIIINLILRLEYEVNAVELSIKKIMGYSSLQKNRKIIFITLSATITSIVLSLIVNHLFDISQSKYFLYGGAILLIIEILFIMTNIARIEKAKISKILKGGSL
ncbi:DUF1430 domain-containing protein [Oceanobacillus jordanicus]|uniref:DUF1430 domain-containing protein n=1 Tax=Oceanobacillus jordanicus TaxID=2867266 RepID=A0AAW5B1V6_9BACI|nr:DUF1430 domain-containing protein [Oceanobacillus jordanicus]MCG3417958.1 DUF1430 domain-containing protein [Oceanobacillus jordanicus]